MPYMKSNSNEAGVIETQVVLRAISYVACHGLVLREW